MKKKRKRRYNVHRKRKYLLISLLVVFVFLGIGYSFLNVDLNILGSITIKKQACEIDDKLYNVLKCETQNHGLAREYTGEHQDSFTETGTEKIYHWYAENDTEGTQILDKNNVIFADHCWQMIRTTDTGGVKIIYNGEVEDNKCLNTRGNHPGYEGRTNQSMSTTYYYGTSYTYDKTYNNFALSGTVTTGTIQIGQYTCKQTTDTATCTTLYYIDTLRSGTSYYVLPINTTSHYSEFGKLQFNQQDNSPAYVGYMYNTRYTYNYKTMRSTETMLSSSTLGTAYWYAHDVIWGSPTVNKYNLDNPYQVSSTGDYPNLVGEYTFRNTSGTYTNTTVQYIAAVDNTTYYYILLDNLGNHTLSDFNYTYTYGDSYTDNGNGTYTINNPTTINRSDWYTGYSNVGANKYVCKNAVNDTCSELWYTISTSNISMTYIKVENNYKYAKGFTYDSGTNTYTLNSDSVSFWNINDSANKTSLNNHHYTCFNTTGDCTTISYIYYLSDTTPYYINLANGKSVEDALDEMLESDNVNQINSTMKTGVDAWYEKYLTEYSIYLEDTIYCNDRSISALNGWNSDEGSLTKFLQFKNYNTNRNLSCTGEVNQFSVSNSKAKLTYPVGLMTSSEMYLLNRNIIRVTGQYYWLASPDFFDLNEANGRRISSDGDRYGVDCIKYTGGVRPAVSLKSGTEYTSGDGSMANPYVVKMN